MRARPGAVLLEVLVALAILSSAGIALVVEVREAQWSVERAQATEHEVVAASRLLEAVSLWPTDDLDRRLGSRSEGRWTLYIERVRPTLYLVTVADSSRTRPLLQTSLYRPGGVSGQP